MKSPAVAEIQGLYGPFTFPETLLQKIWDRRDFDTLHAATVGGQRVRIGHPGQWNHGGGPDFKNARLHIGNASITGDVEVHLREADWHAHHHASDPAHANVVLHVVLFPPQCATTRGVNGREIPVLALLPLLHHDLEQYAADDAVERLAAHPLSTAGKSLSSLTPPELSSAIAHHAQKRWHQKIHFASGRVTRLGWDDACHHTALEILGYRNNRPAMVAIAGEHPLESWPQSVSAQNAISFAERIFNEQTDNRAWAPRSSRPANHPRTRLRQYALWASARPAWPQLLQKFAAGFQKNEPAPASVAEWRRVNKAASLRKRIRMEICGDALGGSRFDTLVCDGFLPLLAAQNHAREETLREAWTNWFAGDMPARFAAYLRALGITGASGTPNHNGAGQGLLGFLLETENAAV
ncbi:hypothetical protein M2447_002524 [Ereboglobus sp. PH5-10]|uniref:DUF2851 family protein n=1 Tax=Ereboglobus sp. PH5-10 TaxID=2940629 RepID=UPI002405E02A|nr:DUF2851 family protein [Ereboglobus sp. PH5-10]MDF9828405.1 hypothetical protein [Ereboglobus sp. PH5-10]